MKNKIKEKNLTVLSNFRRQLTEKPILRQLFFELTDSCNMACLHCGSKASPKNKSFLPFEGVNKVLESVASHYEAKKIMVCLTGGEPMLHPDFYRIVSRVKELGFKCGITTNGFLIDGDTARKMFECGIQSVGISIDGTEELHDWFRNTKGAYRRAFDAVRHLAAAGDGAISLQVTTVVHKKNIETLDEIYAEVLRMGCDSWRIINIDPIGRALTHPELLLDGDDIRYILNYIKQKRTELENPIHVTYGCAHYLGEEFEREVRDYFFMCGSGIFVGSVLSNGDIYSCLDIERRAELVQGNIAKDDFCDVWENRFKAFRRDRTEDCADCIGCEERRFCMGDAAHTWNYNEKKPYICYKKIIQKGEKL